MIMDIIQRQAQRQQGGGGGGGYGDRGGGFGGQMNGGFGGKLAETVEPSVQHCSIQSSQVELASTFRFHRTVRAS